MMASTTRDPVDEARRAFAAAAFDAMAASLTRTRDPGRERAAHLKACLLGAELAAVRARHGQSVAINRARAARLTRAAVVAVSTGEMPEVDAVGDVA